MTQKKTQKLPPPTFLDQHFWRHFAKTIWEKKPLVLRNVKSALLEIGDAEIFDLLVLYSDRCRKQKNSEGFKFYIDGIKTYEEDVLQFLPVKKDMSLFGYHERMSALFADYCLVCDELLKVNLEKQTLLTDFTNELYRHVGFPNRFSEMGLYLGNYRKTPFGVHVDNCGVFSIPVVGTKRFRLWSPAFVKKNPALNRALNYAKYKKNSQLLEAGPGDLTYWPSSAWHIAESDGSFSATWSLGVWVDQTHKDLFSQSLKSILDSKLGPAGLATSTPFKKLHEPTGEVQQLPDIYLRSLAQLQSLTAAELQESFLKTWMIHISQQGFKSIPKVDIKIGLQSRLQLRSLRSPILWQRGLTNTSKLFYCFGGDVVESSKKSKGLLKFIEAINSGETCSIRDYLSGPTRTKDLKALKQLAKAGAFNIISM